jgi:CubicO group peptidase (beta-lactamase class C family)
MTAGLEWREDNAFSDPANSAHAMESTCDWERYVIDRPMQHDPGKVFHYSSGSSQLLAHIFQRASGSDIEEYATRHLFAPLGIREFQWKRTPGGSVNTEGGLYLRPRDLAKIGYLFLQNGVWDGKAVVRPEWVRQSVAPAASVSENSSVKYGYQWWLLPHGDGSRFAWMAAGWGGQLLIVVPEAELILVFTGWNIDPDAPALRPSVALARLMEAVEQPGE